MAMDDDGIDEWWWCDLILRWSFYHYEPRNKTQVKARERDTRIVNQSPREGYRIAQLKQISVNDKYYDLNLKFFQRLRG